MASASGFFKRFFQQIFNYITSGEKIMNIKKFWKVGFSSLTIFLLFFLAFLIFPKDLVAQPPPPGWEVTITITSSEPEVSAVEVSFGVNSASTDGFDRGIDVLGDVIPPSDTPYLSAFFAAARPLKTDMRLDGPWTLIVDSNKDFTFSWDVSQVPADYPLSMDGTDMMIQDSRSFSADKYTLTIEKAIDITVTPSTGGLGTEITVKGTNFGANEEVMIDFAEETGVAQATTDAEGAFSDATFSITVPQPAGPVTIKATGVTSGQSATDSSFVYIGPSIELVEVKPSSVTLGGKLTVTLKGEAGGAAKFSIDGIAVEMVEDPAGTYVATHTVSEGEEGVLYDVTATLTDIAGNPVSITKEDAVEIISGTRFVVTLNSGPNLISLPVDDSRFNTTSDLYNFLSDECQMIIYYDTDDETFGSYGSWSIPGKAEDIELEGDTGLIVMMKEETSITFEGSAWPGDVSLAKGINLIGLPVNNPNIATLSDLDTVIGDNLKTIITQNDEGKFVSHFEAGDLEITGDLGLIVIVHESQPLTLTGEPWSNPPVAETPVISIAKRDLSRADVMVVQGSTVLEETCEALCGLNVTVRNLSAKLSQTDVSGKRRYESSPDGRYSVVFVNLSGRPVAEVGDILRISVEDPSGNFGAESIQHRVTEEDINKGVIALEDLLLTKIPEHPALLQNYPNPFNPETWIPFQLAKPADVTLRIYNLSGQVIRKIDIGYKPAGTYTSSRKAIYWDGRNNFGERVASGIYFYAIKAGSFNEARKMIVVK